MTTTARLERLALCALVLLATSNRPFGKVTGLTFRLDLAAGMLAVVIVVPGLLSRRRPRASPALVALGGFVAFQFFSSVINRGAWPEGIKFSFIYLLGLSVICAVLMLVRDKDTVRWLLGLIVAVTAAEAVVSVLALLSSNLIGIPQPEPIRHRGFPRAEGAMSEANLFASLLLVPFSVALWRWAGRPYAAKIWGAACLALSAGVIFALTRAVWIASIGVTWLSPLRRRPIRASMRWFLVSAGVMVGLLLVSDLVLRQGTLDRTGLYDRLFTGALTGMDEPVDVRLVEAKAALASWAQSPWLGHGAGSGKTTKQTTKEHVGYDRRPYQRPNPWISNAVLFVLHDSGLVGLFLFASALCAAAYQWWRAKGMLGEEDAELDHEALGVGLAATLLAWQVTHGLWQMYGYLFLGLLLASSQLVGGPQTASGADQGPGSQAST